MFKGILNSTTALQGIAFPLSKLPVLLSLLFYTKLNLGLILFNFPFAYIQFELSCQSLYTGQDQGLILWQAGGSVEAVAAHVSMDLQSKQQDLLLVLLRLQLCVKRK